MTNQINNQGQPVGVSAASWTSALPVSHSSDLLEGRTCMLAPVDIEQHCDALYTAFGEDADGRNWTYLPYGPFESRDAFRSWMERVCSGDDPWFYTIFDQVTGKAVGLASYLRIDERNGVIEVGHLHFSPAMQRTPISTEAMYLMMRNVFEVLGYRRYEWKCDALNAPSRAAAERLGFQYEGTFRQATIYKGRNRDTAWFSVIDKEWPELKARFERWLDPGNFDADGRQKVRLGEV